jgi:uracil-DNA glycosylase family 4
MEHPMTAQDLAHMARQQATSLAAAGIEWIPANLPVEFTPGSEVEVEVAVPTAKSTSATKPATKPIALGSDAKRQALQLIDQKEVQGCVKCTELVRNRTRTVFGVGNVDTELLFVGEAPGADEDKAGEPFVGAAGQLLNKIITACKLDRADIYIANVLKCRPPQNRQPLADEVINCKGFLQRQIEIIQPRFICCLGLVAAQTVLNSTTSIGRLRKTVHAYGDTGIKVVATYHPAYLLRNPNAKKDVWDDMKMLMEAMGRPVA